MSTDAAADTTSSGWLLGLGLVAIPVVGVCGAGAVYAYAHRRCQCAVKKDVEKRVASVKPEHDWLRVLTSSDLGDRRVCAVGFPVNLRAASAESAKPVADLRIFEAVETRSCAEVCSLVASAIEKASSPSVSADEFRAALEPLVAMFGEDSMIHFLRSTNVRTRATQDDSWCFTVHVDDDQHMLAICAHASGAADYEENRRCVVYVVFEPAATTAGDETEPPVAADDNDATDDHSFVEST